MREREISFVIFPSSSEFCLFCCQFHFLFAYVGCCVNRRAGDVASQRGELADGVGRVVLGARQLQKDDETDRGRQPIVYGSDPVGDGPSRDWEELRQESQSLVEKVERAHWKRSVVLFSFLFLSYLFGRPCFWPFHVWRVYGKKTGPEYGTTEAAWKGVLVESDRLSDLHTKIKDHLSEDVPTQIKSWQKDAYHKVQ